MSWINLDLITAASCAVVALVCFGLFVITSPKHTQWPSFPQYARRGLAITGWLFMLRSVDFTNLPPGGTGHINALGALTMMALAFTLGSIAYWFAIKVMHPLARQRSENVEEQLRKNPELIPVLVSKDAVIDVSRAIGSEAVGEMGGTDQLFTFADRVTTSNALADRASSC